MSNKNLNIFHNFIRSNQHLLKKGDDNWSADKILLQLAYEHAKDSPITKQAEYFLEDRRVNWTYLKQQNRKRFFNVNPNYLTLDTNGLAEIRDVILINNDFLVVLGVYDSLQKEEKDFYGRLYNLKDNTYEFINQNLLSKHFIEKKDIRRLYIEVLLNLKTVTKSEKDILEDNYYKNKKEQNRFIRSTTSTFPYYNDFSINELKEIQDKILKYNLKQEHDIWAAKFFKEKHNIKVDFSNIYQITEDEIIIQFTYNFLLYNYKNSTFKELEGHSLYITNCLLLENRRIVSWSSFSFELPEIKFWDLELAPIYDTINYPKGTLADFYSYYEIAVLIIYNDASPYFLDSNNRISKIMEFKELQFEKDSSPSYKYHFYSNYALFWLLKHDDLNLEKTRNEIYLFNIKLNKLSSISFGKHLEIYAISCKLNFVYISLSGEYIDSSNISSKVVLLDLETNIIISKPDFPTDRFHEISRNYLSSQDQNRIIYHNELSKNRQLLVMDSLNNSTKQIQTDLDIIEAYKLIGYDKCIIGGLKLYKKYFHLNIHHNTLGSRRSVFLKKKNKESYKLSEKEKEKYFYEIFYIYNLRKNVLKRLNSNCEVDNKDISIDYYSASFNNIKVINNSRMISFNGGFLSIWDLENGKCLKSFNMLLSDHQTISIPAANSRGSNSSVILTDELPFNKKKRKEFGLEPYDKPYRYHSEYAIKNCIVWINHGYISYLDLHNGTIEHIDAHNNQIYGILYLKGNIIVSWSREGNVKIWDLTTQLLISKYFFPGVQRVFKFGAERLLCSSLTKYKILSINFN